MITRQPEFETAAEPRPPGRLRPLIFTTVVAACLVTAALYTVVAVRRDRQGGQAGAAAAVAPEATRELRRGPHLTFLETSGAAFRRVAFAPTNDAEHGRQVSDLNCQRVYVAAGSTLCLGRSANAGGAIIFDADLAPRHTLPISGIPSRARISPDGRLGAMTVFVQGHSYAEGAFSTRTVIVDMATGETLLDLEDLVVVKNDERFRSPDFNFWGVTFAGDGNRFYATLASRGTTYLIEGDLAGRRARVLRENVECPSLSPDDHRLAFKKRINPGERPAVWRLHLLDLATMAETSLTETRNVDDQVEWLDSGQVIYALPDAGPPATIRPDLWAVAVTGDEPPRLLAKGAMSPAVSR